MSDRYVTRPHVHRLLGPTVEVYDTAFCRVASTYTGPYSEERAAQRARELNDATKAQDEDDH